MLLTVDEMAVWEINLFYYYVEEDGKRGEVRNSRE